MKINFLLRMTMMAIMAARLNAGDAVLPSAATTLGDARDIASRSLPFLKEKGVAWIEERECASCHQVPAMLWSLNSAARQRLDIDRKDLAERTAWAIKWQHWNYPSKVDSAKAYESNNDTMVFLLLGRDMTADRDRDWQREFREQLVKNQQPDGSWKPGGQLSENKRPAREISEVSTMWSLLAMQSCGPAEAVDLEVRKRAEAFVASGQPGKSTEWYVVKLLLQPGSEELRNDLFKQQHTDGGWGWLIADPSDAFATGQALYALARSGVSTKVEAVQKAIQFLQTTQRSDGSWQVPSTRAKDKNKVIPTSTYWGTAWAVIGLLEPQGTATGATEP